MEILVTVLMNTLTERIAIFVLLAVTDGFKGSGDGCLSFVKIRDIIRESIHMAMMDEPDGSGIAESDLC